MYNLFLKELELFFKEIEKLDVVFSLISKEKLSNDFSKLRTYVSKFKQNNKLLDIILRYVVDFDILTFF